MALTNVWRKDERGEWVRTTAIQERPNYRYHVSADSHHFRCYSCFHYVEYYPDSETQCCHFRHSRGDVDKDCEDRSTSNAHNAAPDTWDSPAPMKLQVQGQHVDLSVGFLSIDQAQLNKLTSELATWTLSSAYGAPLVYRVDASRFTPHMTTWLPVPVEWASSVQAKFQSKSSRPSQWNRPIKPITPRGAVFDRITGRKVEERGDVEVGREYWLLSPTDYSWRTADVEMSRVTSGNRWYVFLLKADRYTERASNFFFETLHMRLTNRPANISALWPPLIEEDDMLDTNCRRLWLLVEGESDLETYPLWRNPILHQRKLNAQTHLYELSCDHSLQLISAERYSKKLKCLYLRPLDDIPDAALPMISITDEKHIPISEDTLSVPPLHGILYFQSDVDGLVEVSDEDGLIYRRKISAGEELRMTALARGNTLTIRQGLDVVRTIVIAQPKKYADSTPLPIWHGRLVPFPQRYAGVLAHMDEQSELYKRTQMALQLGTIQADGMKCIQQMMEG